MEAWGAPLLLLLLSFIVVSCVSAGENSTTGYESRGMLCSHHEGNCTDLLEPVKRRGHFSQCPKQYKHYCINGKCRYVVSVKTPSCVCEAGYTGARCERLDLFYLRSDRVQIVVISLIAAMVALVAIIICTCVCYHHCRKRRKPRKEEETEALEREPTGKTEETLETHLA
ncbi:probetacellulin isoform X1 [Rhinatrema bivittatum]|uniref:probetacellulin isoform X1 n=1 Tax=Rhinatrema bivittatum TaxID=194408 RepID=UPI0011297FEE|nr:probetacellulin isoform X1 [Rhinatrema bivittatum]